MEQQPSKPAMTTAAVLLGAGAAIIAVVAVAIIGALVGVAAESYDLVRYLIP